MNPSAETRFNKGLAALADAQHLTAADLFLEAMQIESKQATSHLDMRCLSYYGLSLARAGRAVFAGLEACELAVRDQPGDVVLLLNLGRVRLIAGQKDRALDCFDHACRIAPGSDTIRQALTGADRRARPAIPFLTRSNALNRWTGKLRTNLARRWTKAS